MREKINRLARGIVDMEIPDVVVSPSVINEIVRSGETVKRELYITSGNSLNIKGLAYSTSRRVKIANHAFGGLRSHIGYEVDLNSLEHGESVKGSFYLVTNGGEKEIPYSFRVEPGVGGRDIAALKTLEDFTRIAMEDEQAALRLFGYQDFARAPFLQDVHLRALYDGFRGCLDRRTALEEFLVATGAKEPVKTKLPSGERKYDCREQSARDSLVVRTGGWGYFQAELGTDGGFIELSRQSFTSADMEGEVCEIPFRLMREKLHAGNNYGLIRISTVRESSVIRITAIGNTPASTADNVLLKRQKGCMNYLRLRLDYEAGAREEGQLLSEMMRELERLRNENGGDDVLALLMAENFCLSGRKDMAKILMEECRDSVMECRRVQPELFYFYQYLTYLIQNNETLRDELVLALSGYLEENSLRELMFLLLLKLDDRLFDNPGALLDRMKQMYLDGCCSPYLYAVACKLLDREPGLLRKIEGFELQVLNFGARRNMIGETLAGVSARRAAGAKYYHMLYLRLLVTLYGQRPCNELLSAICCMLIKGGRRTPYAFRWYDAGLKAGISLTRLYEYYLYSLPTDYRSSLPKEILLYFSYEKELDAQSKSVLYRNILTYQDPESAIYRAYERDIEQYAMAQMFQSNIDSNLSVIYDHMIYGDMIDIPVAKVLPSILRSCEIRCGNPNMMLVIVCHEELTEEEAFQLKDGVAYVPLFFEQNTILFQDAYGNRYGDVDYQAAPVMGKAELLKRCYEEYPDHPMLRLGECRKIVDRGIQTHKDALSLERVMEDIKLHPLYRRKVLSLLVEFYRNEVLLAKDGDSVSDSSYLIYLDKRLLTPAERTGVCETLISKGYMKNAFEMIQKFGCEKVDAGLLARLCAKMILKKLYDEDELLLKLAFQVFESGADDSVVLDYLCEHFNGTAEEMYRVLKQGIEGGVETYDLEERLLAQMLFSGVTDRIDEVFEMYATRKKVSESLLKAYFTTKSMNYFLSGDSGRELVFEYLEGAVRSIIEEDKAPTIYLLALTKYYSTLGVLDENQRKLCQTMFDLLAGEGLIFPYMQKLGGFITIPDDIADKVMIQYIGDRDSRIDLQVRILPEEKAFHSEDMKRVYQGVFVKQKILFDGEELEYRIYEYKKDEKIMAMEGKAALGSQAFSDSGGRFSCLNEMGIYLAGKDEDGLKRKMREYLIKNAAVEELFGLK